VHFSLGVLSRRLPSPNIFSLIMEKCMSRKTERRQWYVPRELHAGYILPPIAMLDDSGSLSLLAVVYRLQILRENNRIPLNDVDDLGSNSLGIFNQEIAWRTLPLPSKQGRFQSHRALRMVHSRFKEILPTQNRPLKWIRNLWLMSFKKITGHNPFLLRS